MRTTAASSSTAPKCWRCSATWPPSCCIRADGDEGLFRAYDSVEFLAPVYAGDYIEAEGEIVGWARTSRKMAFVARKVIAPRPDLSSSAAEVLGEPVVVCRASGTCVTPKDKQRLTPST